MRLVNLGMKLKAMVNFEILVIYWTFAKYTNLTLIFHNASSVYYFKDHKIKATYVEIVGSHLRASLKDF